MSKKLNLLNQKFSRLLVISLDQNRTHRQGLKWICLCDCGNIVSVKGHAIKSGNTKSCGCFKKETQARIFTKHGQASLSTRTKEYQAWAGIIKRCENKNDKGYKNYGGRGIAICQSWRTSFTSFLKDVGIAPTKDHSIDRINNNGNYEPENCRWATRTEQSQNRRNNRYFEYKGKTKLVAEWCRYLGINHSTFMERVEKFTDPDKIFHKGRIRG